MVNLNNAVIAKFRAGSSNFEILVDCNNAMAFKSGKSVSMRDILAVERVFTDSKKGTEASQTALKQAFGTEDPVEAAKQIIQKGDIQLTAEYRNHLREEKRRQIIQLIQKNGVDPRTHAPHPITRIEAALQEAKIKIDDYRPADQQVNDILKELRVILPIRFEMKEIEIIIPGKYAGKTYPILKSFGKIMKDEWKNDGSHYAVIEIPGGLEQELYDKINAITHGDNTTKILNIR